MAKRKSIVILSKPYRLNPIVLQWIEAFASCAIEGNSLGREMMELWNSGKEEEFVKRLERKWQPELRDAYNDQGTGEIKWGRI